MKSFLSLLQKDFRLEFRQRELLGTLLFLSLTLSAIAALGVAHALVEPPVIAKLFPALFWMIFFFTASAAVGRGSEYENEQRAIDGVILTGTPLPLLYLAKATVTLLVLLLAEALVGVTLGAFLGVSIQFGMEAIIIFLLVAIGFSALITLLGALTSTARLKSLLLPFLALPLLFPLFFCALELTTQLLSGFGIDWSSEWVSLLVGLDVVYLVAGLNLYPFVVQE